ncbi:3'-5' exonuclease domain-containing protein [Rhynchospora pubera]|uniref:3'-5' exonuclease domain-containing protein n=1 Tax=Rhynchospora pubera TaxID=906938 RepID=A0AAV8GNE9_9POAL|nr:3'-5' exonuclease domain-containing protein [Rhynchospora pubera]
MDLAQNHKLPSPIHIVTSCTCAEFTHLLQSLRQSTVVGLDAEWKPRRSSQPDSSPFPPVTLLQIACQFQVENSDEGPKSEVFLVDILGVPLGDVYQPIKEMFESENIIKLGFRFKQDLVFLSHTFSTQGCEPGFDLVAPFLDITNIYFRLKNQNSAKRCSKDTKSLATVCEELLGISLSKELQCSDWSSRPLSEEQIQYAAADAFYLLEIFSVFQQNIVNKGECAASVSVGDDDHCRMMQSILTDFGDKIVLKESDKLPKNTKKKVKQRKSINGNKKENVEVSTEWQGPAPWELSVGGDGFPKFLCDVMIEGLAKHLRCVGIDAALPSSKKPEPRELLSQAYKEKRVLLTRDVKLLRYQYLAENQVYKVKSLLKNDQLVEVIETFKLSISEDQLMSRCTKCNGSFIQKPLTIEEAVEASKGFQVIPSCLFDKNLEFWKCTTCHQLYWEGTQYRHAVDKFVSICKLTV